MALDYFGCKQKFLRSQLIAQQDIATKVHGSSEGTRLWCNLVPELS